MSSEGETRSLEVPELVLESGKCLAPVRVAYRTWGRLAPDGANAVLVCHALTGSADADQWWGDLLGDGCALDPDRDFIICSNTLGSCYGTTGPTSTSPATGRAYGADFPAITIRDMVRLQALLVAHLGVDRLGLVVGGSLGGLQALEWAAMFPRRVAAVAAVAASGRHSSWCIAWSEAQRQAIYADPRWRGGRYQPGEPPAAGLAAARMMAMVSYRSRASFDARFGRGTAASGRFDVVEYLHHHGRALVARFDANSYVTLTRAMDTHDLSRGRGDYVEVLRSIEQPTLIVSIPSDVLYSSDDQIELAEHLPKARLARLASCHGHDGFLVDARALNRQLLAFRRELRPEYRRVEAPRPRGLP